MLTVKLKSFATITKNDIRPKSACCFLEHCIRAEKSFELGSVELHDSCYIIVIPNVKNAHQLNLYLSLMLRLDLCSKKCE